MAVVVLAASLSGCAVKRGEGERPEEGKGKGSPGASSTAVPPSPYVEPGVVDGAPHHGDNNVARRPGQMTAADEKTARADVERIRPVLEKLRKQGRIDPEEVRPALLGLGFRAEDTRVHPPRAEWDNDLMDWVEQPGAMYGVRVGGSACVTGLVNESQVSAGVNGPYPETGCLYPAKAH
ncbi:hypothetical protein LHJ74_23920 [Streptomyces sp. N2-109]|uniref:Lipoprotein n=2 Tax=Streptomyces gossypii TaxID=2883101 RepID=A0ABT2JZ31_9ACTN|nr:hypothetical protein [Streptomyces gossypii]